MDFKEITITEALAELKTIDKRIEKKRAAVNGYLVRDSKMRDPLEKQGGSEKYVASEMQAIDDLEARKVTIRRTIAEANLKTPLKLGTVERSIHDWLTWRRDVAENKQRHLNNVAQALAVAREQAKRSGRTVANVAAVVEGKDDGDVIVNLDEKRLREDIEALETTLGDLDGQLSLLNATVKVPIPA